MVGNLRKAQKICARLLIILGREGSSPRVSVMLFKAVVQVVLLFGADMWVMTPRIGRALGEFQHRVAQRIVGREPQRQVYRSWDYPPLETEMQEVGFK